MCVRCRGARSNGIVAVEFVRSQGQHRPVCNSMSWQCRVQVSAAALKVMLTLVSVSPEYLGGSQLNAVCNLTVRPLCHFELPHSCSICFEVWPNCLLIADWAAD